MPRAKHLRRTHKAKTTSEHRETRIALHAGRMPADVDGNPSAWVEKTEAFGPTNFLIAHLTTYFCDRYSTRLCRNPGRPCSATLFWMDADFSESVAGRQS